MPRPIWKGDISFGLVSIPIAIFPVKRRNDLSFHLLDAKDHSPIQYQRINSNTGKIVPWKQVLKGYQYKKDEYMIIDEEAFEKASPEIFKSIDIVEFVNLNEIDSIYFEKAYYIIPTSKNKKAYVLLREALNKTHKAGVAKIIMRTKEYLSLIQVHGSALLLNLIHFQEELQDEKTLDLPEEDIKNYKISDREMKMAITLIDEMTTGWQPEKYHNDYREALKKWIDEKAMTKTIKTTKKKTEVIDFIKLLKQSMGKSHKKAS